MQAGTSLPRKCGPLSGKSAQERKVGQMPDYYSIASHYVATRGVVVDKGAHSDIYSYLQQPVYCIRMAPHGGAGSLCIAPNEPNVKRLISPAPVHDSVDNSTPGVTERRAALLLMGCSVNRQAPFNFNFF